MIYACAAVGVVMAVLATRVSYLEDQALRRDQMGRAIPNYYDEIVPAPGRPSNRYRLEHIPFVTAMKTPGWSESPILGRVRTTSTSICSRRAGNSRMASRSPRACR